MKKWIVVFLCFVLVLSLGTFVFAQPEDDEDEEPMQAKPNPMEQVRQGSTAQGEVSWDPTDGPMGPAGGDPYGGETMPIDPYGDQSMPVDPLDSENMPVDPLEDDGEHGDAGVAMPPDPLDHSFLREDFGIERSDFELDRAGMADRASGDRLKGSRP
ncbi:hypothetical protein ACFLZ3_05285 [Candidatus Omnitrophota bacterium]